MIRPLLFLLTLSLFSNQSVAQAYTEIQKFTAPNRQVSNNFGAAIDYSGDYAIAGSAYEDSVNGTTLIHTQSGAAYIYKKDSTGSWVVHQKLTASVRQTAELFGYDVAINGDIAVVGAINYSSTTLYQGGAAYIFKRNAVTDTWTQIQRIEGSTNVDYGDFGWSVAISGTRILVGDLHFDSFTPYVPNNPGAAYVFEQTIANTWTQVAHLTASDMDQGQNFGCAVDINGDELIVGAYGEYHDTSGLASMPEAGAAYIFKRNSGNNWVQTQKIVNSDRRASNKFGNAVAISDSAIIVSATGNSFNAFGQDSIYQAGAAYVFQHNSAGKWNEVDKLVSVHRGSYGHFGNAVDISGSRALVGAMEEDSNLVASVYHPASGAIYLYESNGQGNWNIIQKMVASDQDDADLFGCDVKLKNGSAMIGAYGENLQVPFNNYSGAAYFFSCQQTGIDTVMMCSSDSLYLGGVWRKTPGVYIDTLTTANFCDSIVTITVDTLSPDVSYISDTICEGEGIFFGATLQTSTGVYQETLQNMQGCDSVVWLSLEVLNPKAPINQSNDSLLLAPLTNATYQWFNCDSNTIVSGATNPFFIPTIDGAYACIVMIGRCLDTSACLQYVGFGLEDYSLNAKVYPNPAKHKLFVEWDNLNSQNCSLKIIDITGKTLMYQPISETKSTLDISQLPAGVYHIQLEQDGYIEKRRLIHL